MRVTRQTVRLGAGKHSSPEEGACVMELASMLAGEEFSDRPRCVSPVVGAFLRVYNDFVGDVRRQDLRAIASTVVGSAAPESVEEARLRRLVGWSDELWALRRRRPLLGRLRRALAR